MKRLYNFLLPLLLWAPDGAGGGGASPEEIPLEDWIKRLNETEKKGRNAVVGELAKALGIKTGEAYKKLKEAGWDPKAGNDKNFINDTPPAAGERPGPDTVQLPDDTPPPPSANTGGGAAGGNPPPPVKTFSVALRHKTPYPGYRRAGIVLTGQWKPYAVTAAQLAALKTDNWVEIQETGEPDKK
jgi:hypothetical protein